MLGSTSLYDIAEMGGLSLTYHVPFLGCSIVPQSVHTTLGSKERPPLTSTRDEMPQLDPTSSLTFIAEASAWYRHAEVVVQQRLNNFLVVATILLAAIGAVLAATPPASPTEAASIVLVKHRANFVLGLSFIGTLLGIAYMVLGARQQRFVQLHKDMVMHLGKAIESHELQFLREFTQLQDGMEVRFPHSGERVKLHALQQFGTSSLLVLAPGAFTLLFLCLGVLMLANSA